MKWFKRKEENWRPEFLQQYHKDRALITEIVKCLTGRENDLEEWYVYQLAWRDSEISKLKEEIFKIKESAPQ